MTASTLSTMAHADWDPVAQYTALAAAGVLDNDEVHPAKANRMPSPVEKMQSVMPVGAHEVSYQPEKRFNAMAKYLRVPRGFKDVAHLEMLRVSDPCLGTLLPQCERVQKHEVPYRPERRFAALARQLREPKGTKSLEHLEALRQSDPCYGSLLPTSTSAMRDAACRLVASRAAASLERAASLSSSASSLSPQGSSHASDGDDESRDAELDEEGWQMLRSSTSGSGRLPRILSNHIFDSLDDDDDERDEVPDLLRDSSAGPSPRALHKWAPPPPKTNPAYAFGGLSPGRLAAHRRQQRLSYEDDDASVRSMARTSVERSSERSSNNTICDFLDDRGYLEEGSEGSGSGEWSPRDALSGVRTEGLRWAASRDALKAELKAELKGEVAPSPTVAASHRKLIGGAAKQPKAAPAASDAAARRLVGGGR